MLAVNGRAHTDRLDLTLEVGARDATREVSRNGSLRVAMPSA
jgi:hypothetical protein